MENQEDKDKKYVPPTPQQLYESITAPGTYIGRCKKCDQVVRVRTLEEFNKHKCHAKT